jgi:hypothetical protein
MRALTATLLLVVSFGSVSIACGGSTQEGNDGGVSAAGGSGTGGNSSASCDVVGATAAQVQTLVLCDQAIACVKVECKQALATCMGDNYESGVYAGRGCSDYANCAKSCNCVQSCMNANCALSSSCADCLNTDLLYAVIASDNCAAAAYRCVHGG